MKSVTETAVALVVASSVVLSHPAYGQSRARVYRDRVVPTPTPTTASRAPAGPHRPNVPPSPSRTTPSRPGASPYSQQRAPYAAGHPSPSAHPTTATIQQQLAAIERMRARALQTGDTQLLYRANQMAQQARTRLAWESNAAGRSTGRSPQATPNHRQQTPRLPRENPRFAQESSRAEEPRFRGPPPPPPDIEEVPVREARRASPFVARPTPAPPAAMPTAPDTAKPLKSADSENKKPESADESNGPEFNAPIVGDTILR